MPVKRLSSDMVEHDELVNELPQVEKMSTAERLKHAKKRRIQQLKKFAQYEKQLDKEQNKKNKKSLQNKKVKRSDQNRRVIFVNNVILLEAAARNDVTEVTNLLTRSVDPDVTNEDGLTALHQCCIDDLEEMLRLLLKHGANVNAQDSEMWTPLHAAATCGHIHLCRILIENGAELLAVNADGNMPYDICEDELTLDFIENEMAKRGVTQEQIDETRLSTEVKMLKDLQKLAKDNGDLEYRGRVMETPLHIAAANGYVQVTEFLMKHHVSVSVEDDDSWQPIHAAACWGHLPVLEILVQHGADLEAKTKNGETPFDICEDIEMRERLMDLKSEIAAKGQVKSRSLVRRRSTNTRSSVVSNSSGSIYSSNTSLAEKNHLSASVRRVSSKEKGAISFKEAVEEGRRLRESVSDNEDDDGQNVQNGVTKSKEGGTKVEDVQVFMPVTESSPKSSPRGGIFNNHQASPQSSPRDETTNPIPPPAAFAEDKPVSKPSPAKNSSRVSQIQEKFAQQNKKQVVVETVRTADSPRGDNETQKDKQKVSRKKAPSPTAVTSQEQPAPSLVTSQKEPALPLVTSQKEKAPPSTKSQKAQPMVTSTDSVASSASSKKSQKKTAPQPPSEVKKPDSTASKQEPTTQQGSNHIEHSGNGAFPAATRDDVEPEVQDGFVIPDRARNPPGGAHLPHGTLSDLKKQRAQRLQERLQDSLRFKDGDKPPSEENNFNQLRYGESAVSVDPATQQAQYNNGGGQNGNVQQQQQARNNNSYYVEAGNGDTIKKYKFSDTSSVVGDRDKQTSCCVVQ